MSYYQNNGYNCNCSSNYNIVSGNSLDIDVDYCEPEIRADIVVSEYKSVRLWGRIINCDKEPVENALVKLLKVECDGNHTYYKGIAHTISDCEGFYQFELCDYDDGCSHYKILVNKAAYGPEKVIPIDCNNCEPCLDPNPCDDCGINRCDISSSTPNNYYSSDTSSSYEIDNNYNCLYNNCNCNCRNSTNYNKNRY